MRSIMMFCTMLSISKVRTALPPAHASSYSCVSCVSCVSWLSCAPSNGVYPVDAFNKWVELFQELESSKEKWEMSERSVQTQQVLTIGLSPSKTATRHRDMMTHAPRVNASMDRVNSWKTHFCPRFASPMLRPTSKYSFQHAVSLLEAFRETIDDNG